MRRTTRSRRLGVLGGVGPRATATLYTSLVRGTRERAGGESPDILIANLPVTSAIEEAFIAARPAPRLERQVDAMLAEELDRLMAAGVQAVAVPCNTLEARLAPLVGERGLKAIGPVEATVAAARARGARRLLLAATTTTAASGAYARAAAASGIEALLPDAEAQARISAGILALLADAAAVDVATEVWPALRGAAAGCDAVALACTDLHELLPWAPEDAMVVDSLSALAEACIDWLLAEGPDWLPARAALARPATATEEPRRALREIARWLGSDVIAPDPRLGRAGGLCPFVGKALRNDGILLADGGDVARPVAELGAEVLSHGRALAAGLSHPGADPDTSVVVVFTDPSGVGGEPLAEVRRAVKPTLMADGLTCGEFYPTSDDRSVRNADVLVARSPWPCVAVRPLTPHDELFLKGQEDLHPLFVDWRSRV